jgi:hypothetical protein
LFEPVHQAFDPTALTIERPIKGSCTALGLAPWNGEPETVRPQVVPDVSTAVPLVADDAVGAELGATTTRPLHGTLVHQRLKHGGFMLLARRQEQRQEFALPLSTEMNFGAETAVTPA